MYHEVGYPDISILGRPRAYNVQWKIQTKGDHPNMHKAGGPKPGLPNIYSHSMAVFSGRNSSEIKHHLLCVMCYYE